MTKVPTFWKGGNAIKDIFDPNKNMLKTASGQMQQMQPLHERGGESPGLK